MEQYMNGAMELIIKIISFIVVLFLFGLIVVTLKSFLDND